MQANINYLVLCSLISLENCLVLEETPSRDFRQILVQKCPSLVKVQCERRRRLVNGRFCSADFSPEFCENSVHAKINPE